MDAVGGPDAKKARWSPTSFGTSNGQGGMSSSNNRDAFANYGYGPNANIAQSGFNNSSPSGGFGGNPLYSTPQLSINTAAGGNGVPSQMSPNTAGPFTPQQQQPPSANGANGNGPYGGFNGYNMLMGLPAMGMLGGFPYNTQMMNFAQVSSSADALRWCYS